MNVLTQKEIVMSYLYLLRDDSVKDILVTIFFNGSLQSSNENFKLELNIIYLNQSRI